jgi:hypothetical protein
VPAAARRADVDELHDIPLMLAAATDAVPTLRAFHGWQGEPKYDGYLY